MRVGEVVAGQQVVTARLDTPLREVIDLMRARGVGGIPVVDEWGALAGLVTATRVVRVAREWDDPADLPHDGAWHPGPLREKRPGDWRDVKARDVMVTDLCTVDEDTDVRAAARTLINRDVHRAVVLGKDRNVRGILSALDFVLLVAEGRAP